MHLLLSEDQKSAFDYINQDKQLSLCLCSWARTLTVADTRRVFYGNGVAFCTNRAAGKACCSLQIDVI